MSVDDVLIVLATVVLMAISFVAGLLWRGRAPRTPTPEPRTPAATSPVLARARALVNEMAPYEQSGEWKRHQVYARLTKEFPGISRRMLSRAIEDALGD